MNPDEQIFFEQQVVACSGTYPDDPEDFARVLVQSILTAARIVERPPIQAKPYHIDNYQACVAEVVRAVQAKYVRLPRALEPGEVMQIVQTYNDEYHAANPPTCDGSGRLVVQVQAYDLSGPQPVPCEGGEVLSDTKCPGCEHCNLTPAADWWTVNTEAQRFEYVGPKTATAAQGYQALILAQEALPLVGFGVSADAAALLKSDLMCPPADPEPS
jgi:hypothetical protein